MHNKGFWLMSLMAVVCSLPAAAQISNGTNLTVPVDGYGSWYTNFQTGGSFGESFQPCGFSAGYPTFSAGTFIFVEGVHRGILTDYAPWIGIFASNPAHLNRVADERSQLRGHRLRRLGERHGAQYGKYHGNGL